MNIVGPILFIALLAYLYSCPVVIGYAVWQERNLSGKPLFGIRFLNGGFFMYGALIAVFILIEAGAERVLFFLQGEEKLYFSLVLTVVLLYPLSKSKELDSHLKKIGSLD